MIVNFTFPDFAVKRVKMKSVPFCVGDIIGFKSEDGVDSVFKVSRLHHGVDFRKKKCHTNTNITLEKITI